MEGVSAWYVIRHARVPAPLSARKTPMSDPGENSAANKTARIPIKIVPVETAPVKAGVDSCPPASDAGRQT